MNQPTPFRFIRETVFSEPTAAAFADLIGISAGHLSRLESGAAPSFPLMIRVRRLARERALDWNDRFFFEADVEPEKEAA